MPVELKRLKTESVVQQIINTLTQAIIDGDLKPGDQIPTELEMASKMGVARTSVREATKILAYLGILESRRAEGTFVAEGFRESMIDPMVYGVLITGSQDFDHLMELRQTVESGIIQLAAVHRTPEGLARLRSRLDDMQAVAEFNADNEVIIEKIFAADSNFHDTVSELMGNPLMRKIERIVRTLTLTTRLETERMMVLSGRLDELVQAHREIYEIVAGKEVPDLNAAIRRTYFLDDLRNRSDR